MALPKVCSAHITTTFYTTLSRLSLSLSFLSRSSGKVWGEDIILDVPELIDHSQAVALTYCEVYTLGRAELDELLGRFPRAERRVPAKKVTLQKAFIMYLAKNAGRKARSFIPRSAASGFNEVPHFAGM